METQCEPEKGAGPSLPATEGKTCYSVLPILVLIAGEGHCDQIPLSLSLLVSFKFAQAMKRAARALFSGPEILYVGARAPGITQKKVNSTNNTAIQKEEESKLKAKRSFALRGTQDPKPTMKSQKKPKRCPTRFEQDNVRKGRVETVLDVCVRDGRETWDSSLVFALELLLLHFYHVAFPVDIQTETDSPTAAASVPIFDLLIFLFLYKNRRMHRSRVPAVAVLQGGLGRTTAALSAVALPQGRALPHRYNARPAFSCPIPAAPFMWGRGAALQEGRRLHSTVPPSSTAGSSSGGHGAPPASAGGKDRSSSAQPPQSVADAALAYEEAPPRPPAGAYVPPEERSADDASLEFLPDDHPMKQRYLAGEPERRERQRREAQQALAAAEEAEEAAALQRRWRRLATPFKKKKRGAEEAFGLGEDADRPPLPEGGGSPLRRAPALAAWEKDNGRPGPGALVEAEAAALPPPPPENRVPVSRGDYDVEKEQAEEALIFGIPERATRSSSSSSSSSDAAGQQMRGGEQEPTTSTSTTFTRPGAGNSPSQEGVEEETAATFAEAAQRQAASPPKSSAEEGEEGDTQPRRRPPHLTRTQEMELEMQKLEFYFGTPQYPDLVAAFKKKFEAELSEEGEKDGDGATAENERQYTPEEVMAGLSSQPIDYHRSSKKLQMQLNQGPRAYDLITNLQRQGLMRFQGYAFPPSTVLGELKGVQPPPPGADPTRIGGEAEVTQHWEAVDRKLRGSGPRAIVRRAWYSLLGREDPRHQHLAPSPGEAGQVRLDNSLAFRLTGLDVMQRRQMRFMLTDFDYADRQTAFHVMMTYPYTDWIHAFYMVAVGFTLYYLQIHYNAYDFYDEFLGLDLRQAPSAKKPFLVMLTTTVMVFFLFQPLLVASIATTRAYRIIRRRPIGPP
eukprot:gene840-477_t